MRNLNIVKFAHFMNPWSSVLFVSFRGKTRKYNKISTMQLKNDYFQETMNMYKYNLLALVDQLPRVRDELYQVRNWTV